VDQRTRAVLTHKLKKEGATETEIHRALYLAALSQFCIYNPLHETQQNWTLRVEASIHKLSMVKASCTLRDFHRALRARDPLGLGFDDSSDNLLQLIWQLLAWNPEDRILPAVALKHAYFVQPDSDVFADDDSRKALESQMLDPRMDFNLSTFVLQMSSRNRMSGALQSLTDRRRCGDFSMPEVRPTI
jgi:serine/threonine protein kinase